MTRQTERENRPRSVRRSESGRKKPIEKKAPTSPLLRILRGTAFGVISGIGIGAVLLLAVTGIVCSQNDPDALLYPVSLLLLGVASLVCGMVAARTSDTAFLPTGVTAAIGWLLITLLLSLFVSDGIGAFPSVYALFLRIPQALLVIFGAFLGKNRPRKPSVRRRNR